MTAKDFAARHGLRRTESKLCLARLVDKRCGQWGSQKPHPLCAIGHGMEGTGPLDHGTHWSRDGRTVVVVGQPYQLHARDLHALAELEVHFGLSVLVHSGAWHNEGCMSVEIWADGEAGQ
jgi:hypothetical protein